MKKLNLLSQQIHQNALDKGFWTDHPSVEHHMMLVISEIAEMVEADRNVDGVKIRHLHINGNLAATQQGTFMDEVENAEDFDATFKTLVKNTIEDEMADVAIRLLDIAGHLGMDFTMMSTMRYHRDFTRFGFTENALALCKGLTRDNINIFRRIHFGLHYVFNWAKASNIKLMWHIKAKMRYNANRPALHGKKY